MAGKKFSRLSVLLEAKDKMSGPMKQAASASQGLQSRISQLSGQLNKSRSSIVNASTSTRVLAEGYRELGKRVGVTDDKIKSSVKIFRSLPRSVRDAAYSLEGYSKALLNTAKNTLTAKIGAKILSATLTGLSATARGLSGPFNTIANKAKQIGANLLNVAKGSKAFDLLSAKAKLAANHVKLVAESSKFLAKTTTSIVQNSKAWNLVGNAVDKTKGKLQAGYLAFNLWKNASPTLDKIAGKFEKIGASISKMGNPLRREISNLSKLSGAFSKVEGRGRATFNQLASSNARLNRELQKMNSELSKANSRLGSMKSSLGSINGMGTAFGLAYGGQAAYGAGEKVVTNTVGTAMEQQYSSESVGILAGAKNGAKFYRQIQDYAASTAYSAEDWSRSMRGAISKSKTVDDLKVYQTALEQLATLDPVQGLDGAALAIRELNSGDSQSLVERFELPRSAINSIKNMEDPVKQMVELTKIVGKETGYTVDNIAKMKELPLMQWQKMTNIMKTALGYMGGKALEVIAPLIEKFNQLWDSGKLDGFVSKMNNALGNMASGLVNMFGNFDASGIAEKFAPFRELLSNVWGSFKEAWPNIKTILDNMREVLGNVAGTVNENWGPLNELFQTSLGYVKDISNWIVENWSGIEPIVVAAATSFAAWKILTAMTPIIEAAIFVIKGLRNATLLATGAQWALNLAMDANPIGLVILAISALIGIGVLLYQNWDTVKQKCVELWEKFGILIPMISGMLGPFGLLIGAGITLIANWGTLKDTAVSIWETIVNAFIDGANGAIGAINSLIGAINKIPGVDVGPISEIDSYSAMANEKVSVIRNQGGMPKRNTGTGLAAFGMGHRAGLETVPYDGYQARLHKGERIQTKQEVKEDNKLSGISITGNTFNVREESDIDKIADALLNKLLAAKIATG